MRLPAKPPTFHEVSVEIGAESSMDAWQARGVEHLVSAANSLRYMPWEKVRRLALPDGYFSHKYAWAAVKYARWRDRQQLTLADGKGVPFCYWVPRAFLSALHEIDTRAAGEILVDVPDALPEARDRYVINSLMEEAIASSQIEGAATTRRVAKDLLRSGRKPTTRGEKMIVNNFVAMRRLRELKDVPLSVELLCGLQRTLVRDTLDDSSAAGRLRVPTEDDIAVYADDNTLLHQPPPACELPERLALLCEYANTASDDRTQFEHPVIKAIVIHFWLAYIHPFVDGNGRTARALFHWYAMKHGYWLMEFLPVSRVIRDSLGQYLRAYLHAESDENDATYFVAYHLRVIVKAIDALRQYLRRKQREMATTLAALDGASLLNYRQKALVTHAVKHPGFDYSVASHKVSHGVSTQTARNDLARLAQLGLLIPSKQGRRHIWLAPRDLQHRLDELS